MKFKKIIKSISRNCRLKKKLVKSNQILDTKSITFKDKNILIIDSIIPEYNKDSGSRRLNEIIKVLLKNEIGVFLLADYAQYRYRSEYINYYKNLGVNVYEPKIYKGKLFTKRDFIKYISPQLDYAWLHRPLIFKKYNSFIKKLNQKTQLIFDMCDFHYVRYIRQWEREKNIEVKKIADRFLTIELNNFKKSDLVIAISSEDKKLVKTYYDDTSKFKILSNIHQFIDSKDKFISFDKRKDLLFVGNFGHTPNIDAVHFLKEKIMPIVWNTLPDLKVNIIGSHVTEDIKNLNTNNFRIIGYVEDLQPYLKSSKLFVAPLRFGAGIKGKIGQSLEHSLPVVTTNIGAEGFDFGTILQYCIANEDYEIANKIIQFQTDEDLWNTVSQYSEQILKPFSLDNIEEQILNILNR